ncbi:MAG: hypothetical protein FIB06_08515 [Betaproteobacteria bacterium]|nr:hypothetical protein [Betaproteobacteria bacterium]
MREQLDSTAGLSPYETAMELTGHILPAIGRKPRPDERFKLLEDARAQADKALPVLERHVDFSNLPLPLPASTSALAADNLLKGLANGYHRVARDLIDGGRSAEQRRLALRAIRRGIILIARRQHLAYRTYSKPSSSAWLLMHELYQMARQLQDHAPREEVARIERYYLGALLCAYLDPGKLPRNNLPAAVACTGRLAQYARITELMPDLNTQGSGSACFLVDPEKGEPGNPVFRMPKGTPVFDGFIVDCNGVLDALARSQSIDPGVPPELPLDYPQEILHALHVAIGGKSTRRFHRKRFRPRADLVGGISDVIAFIDINAHTRRAADVAQMQRAANLRTSEWSLLDQSPDGFLVRFLQGDKWLTGVGNIVALHPRESSRLHVCVVRRISTDDKGRLELGLQALSPQVSVVELPAQGEIRRGIYMHRLPAFGNRPGLIARPGHVASGLRLQLDVAGTATEVQVGRRIESSDGMEFYALIPLAS